MGLQHGFDAGDDPGETSPRDHGAAAAVFEVGKAMERRDKDGLALAPRLGKGLLHEELGGIVGHNFLSKYKVAFDIDRSELRLDRF